MVDADAEFDAWRHKRLKSSPVSPTSRKCVTFAAAGLLPLALAGCAAQPRAEAPAAALASQAMVAPQTVVATAPAKPAQQIAAVAPKQGARSATGLASFYGSGFHGRKTANGELFDMQGFTAAHPSFPLPSYARVTNVSNGRSIVVRVNDRGPHKRGRLIDVSQRTADVLGFRRAGVSMVKIDYVGPASDDRDDRTLVATYQEFGRPSAPEGVQVASLRPLTDAALLGGRGAGAPQAGVVTVAETRTVAMPDARPAPQPLFVEDAHAPKPQPKAPVIIEARRVAPPVARPAARVIAPSEPALASVVPTQETKTPEAPIASTIAANDRILDASSRVAASFEGFGETTPFRQGPPPGVTATAFAERR